MPTKPKRPCAHAGCPNLTHDRYCPAHAPLYQRESAAARGYGAKWRGRRAAFLKRFPLCAECQRQGRLTPATVVDHIRPHRGDTALMWDEANWQPLCKPCHDRKTGAADSAPEYKYDFEKGARA
jgi:5-methylcytosine-specific restriction protein A